MNQLASRATAVVYRRAVKPLLFKSPPDNVHSRMMERGERVQKSAVSRRLLSAAWSYRNPPVLGQKLNGVTFSNPVGLSAGFDKNFRLPPLIKALGFGFMEGGSVTLQPCDGNPKPWFYRLPRTRSIVVHAGLANDGARAIIVRIKRYPKDTWRGFPINVSVAKTNSPQACSEKDAIDDYIGSLRLIKTAAVGQMITLNISCPNTYGGEPFSEAGKLERLLTCVDELALAQTVFIKMPVDLPWPEFKRLLAVADKHRIAGVTIGNLAKDRTKLQLKDSLPANVRGGLSGKPTWELSNDFIRRTRMAYGERFTIIGVGGIFSAEDAYTKIKLGANLVELITGMIYEGPQLIGQINRGLVRLLQRDGLANIAQAVGRDVNKK